MNGDTYSSRGECSALHNSTFKFTDAVYRSGSFSRFLRKPLGQCAEPTQSTDTIFLFTRAPEVTEMTVAETVIETVIQEGRQVEMGPVRGEGHAHPLIDPPAAISR